MADGHGGAREGKPGRAYGNRLDLNANKQPQQVVTGQKRFGAAAEQQQALQAIPLPSQPAMPRAIPGQVVDLFAPSERPSEPLTAGAPFGPGPGALPSGSVLAARLRAIYQILPSESLRELLEDIEEEGD